MYCSKRIIEVKFYTVLHDLSNRMEPIKRLQSALLERCKKDPKVLETYVFQLDFQFLPITLVCIDFFFLLYSGLRHQFKELNDYLEIKWVNKGLFLNYHLHCENFLNKLLIFVRLIPKP